MDDFNRNYNNEGQRYQQHDYNYNNMNSSPQNSYYNGRINENNSNNSDSAFTLGISSLILLGIFQPVSLILAIIGMTYAVKAKNNHEYENGESSAGYVLNLISLILNILLILIVLFFILVNISMLSRTLSNDNGYYINPNYTNYLINNL